MEDVYDMSLTIMVVRLDDTRGSGSSDSRLDPACSAPAVF